MKIYQLDTASDFEKLDLCLAIGNFDGIHKGHQEIINKIKEIASNNNLLSSIMSFNPHPRIYFNQINEPFNIYTQNDKINFLERLGLDIFIDFSFDNNLSILSADEFVTKILIDKLNIKYLVIGSDFKFGKDRKGNFKTLEKHAEKKIILVFI
jgi:riboflavin kinase/FMN adenylyltransferase